MTTETLEFDVLRQRLIAKVKQVSLATGVPIMLPNSPFNQPTDGSVFAEFNLMTGGTKRMELGSGMRALECTVAVLQIDFYVQENTGDGAITRAANQWKRAFNEITLDCGAVGYMITEAMGVRAMTGNNTKKGFYRVMMDGPLDFYHRNPDAPITS